MAENTALSTRLLLVDDDETFTRVLAKAMRKRGYEVAAAHTVESGIAQAQSFQPALAVVDLKLPDSSGLFLIQELIAVNPAMKIVMLTGYSSIATAVEAVKKGAVHYLPKPATADEILHAFSLQSGDPEVAISTSPPSVERLEWEHIQRVLAENEGNISATARALNMHRRTLQRKLAKHPVKS